MKQLSLFWFIFTVCINLTTSIVLANASDFADMTKVEDVVDGEVYRMGETGICGTIEDDHIQVTHILPDSIAEGKILVGDKIRGMQHRGMGGWGGIHNLVSKRLYRIGRDWDWHFYVTVERPSLRDGRGNIVTYDLHMPPDPGQICHYGPTGFFAKRFTDHLIVDLVEEGSPSDGKLQKGDIIIAVDGKPITVAAYDQFTQAIDRAEAKKGGGTLSLTVKRVDSATDFNEIVVVSLDAVGTYSETSPYDCVKTDTLITKTADYLVEQQSYGTLYSGLLGLLATGEDQYIRVVSNYLHDAEWAQPPQNPDEPADSGGLVSWRWGYRNILMTEYYLLTKDAFVLPAIRAHARAMAAGQDQAGLWGHRMCHPELGRAYGYGVMNQPSMTIFISLILSEKCGIKDSILREAIRRTHDHFDNWIGEGALPYGNHHPVEHQFTNNGTSGSLALAFALLGNHKGASFYAQMSAAASDEILTGHSGPWWNILWSGLGVNLLGPEMTSAYYQKMRWLHTVTRCWDGRYVGIKGWGSDPKSGRLSDTGSHLMNLCVGRRTLYITGKDMDESIWIGKVEAKEILDAGIIRDTSEEALLTKLGSRFPPVRVRAAQELARQDAHVTKAVMQLLKNGTTDQRIGAMHAIRNLKIEGAEGELLKLVKDPSEDAWVRQLAVGTLVMMDAKDATSDLLTVLVEDKPNDPYQELDIALGTALAKLYEPDPYATNLDKDLFYRAVSKLLAHKHSTARGAGMRLIYNIPKEDLPRMLDQVVYLIEDEDRTYTAYTGNGRQEGLEILYRHGIKESMEYTVNTIKEPTGRGGPRQRDRTRLLKKFGAEAEYLIPRIREVLGKNAEEVIQQIEQSETARDMVSIDEFMDSEK